MEILIKFQCTIIHKKFNRESYLNDVKTKKKQKYKINKITMMKYVNIYGKKQIKNWDYTLKFILI